INDGQRTITVSKTGSGSTVLWNPHIAKAKATSDFGDDEWPGMLCVESAAIGEEKIHLDVGAAHVLSVKISTAST
ncbi:MAG: D-hexose-6-phosphate mutarotase, partial [Planctomycetota bacterium]